MKYKLEKTIIFFIILVTLITNIVPVLAISFNDNQIINLQKDHECFSLLKVQGKDMLKMVEYVVYIDPTTGEKQPAFCVEPNKEGIGTGAGENYDVTLKLLHDERLWRVLYKGYMGSQYTSWGLEYDDDLYYATKTAIHCLVDGITPKAKYEIPHRVGRGENISLEDVQRRGGKVLEVAQQLYDYGVNGKEDYSKPTVEANKSGGNVLEKIDGIEYLIQSYNVTGNRGVDSYNVSASDFPEGTKILNNLNIETSKMNNSEFKIAIPSKEIKSNVIGKINITDAKVKTYPVFYAEAYIDDYQDYITYADSVESANTTITLDIDAYKSSIKLTKLDKEKDLPIHGVSFEAKYADNNELIGEFVTDENGEIDIPRLRQGKIILIEKSTLEEYELDSTPINIELEYSQEQKIQIYNEYKKGNIKIVKTSEDRNNILNEEKGSPIDGAKFNIYDENNKLVEQVITDKNGIAISSKLKKGKYTIQEVESGKWYILDNKKYNVEISENEQTIELNVTNKSENPNVDIVKKCKSIIKANEEIDYEFKIKNNGNTDLKEFTWYDILPSDYAKITKISTGTYNQDITYSIYYRTNQKNEYMVVKKDLSSTENKYIDLSNIHLEENEKITEIKVSFGNVKVGFENLEKPHIFMKANDDLQDNTLIENNTILEGYDKEYKVCDEDTASSIVYNIVEKKKLPRTGF